MRKLGEDPETGVEVSVRSGRFGSYLQLGEASKDEDGKAIKPKRASLPKGVSPDDVDLDQALKLLALPREVGRHPDDKEPIIAGIGRFGPYVKHGKTYANIETGDDVITIGLNRAVTLIEEKKLKPGKGRRFGADPGRPLGDHPQKGGPIVVKNGRYGPYVSHDGVNATLPGGMAPDNVSLEQAIGLIDARAEKTGGTSARRKRPARQQATAKATAPKSAAPKMAAKTAAKMAAKPRKRAAASQAKVARKPKAEAAE
jgi:DNA topoisomerase-1